MTARAPAKERLSDAVYQKLFSMILAGELRTGEPLQERRIAELVGVSRSPVRDAIKRLAVEGLIEGDGRLPTVRLIDANEALEIIAIRMMFEPKCAALAAARPDAERVLALIAEIDALARTDSPTAEEHWTLDDRIHASIAEIAGFRLLNGILAELRTKTRMFNKNTIPERFVPGCNEHRAILTAVLAGEAEAAEAAMQQHLANTRAGIIARLRVRGR
jgi:DNA-binding GntR family transcriptional regulator